MRVMYTFVLGFPHFEIDIRFNDMLRRFLQAVCSRCVLWNYTNGAYLKTMKCYTTMRLGMARREATQKKMLIQRDDCSVFNEFNDS